MNPRLHLRSHFAGSALALLMMLFFSACDPNGEGEAGWPAFDSTHTATQVIGPVPVSQPGVDKERLDLMGLIWPMQ